MQPLHSLPKARHCPQSFIPQRMGPLQGTRGFLAVCTGTENKHSGAGGQGSPGLLQSPLTSPHPGMGRKKTVTWKPAETARSPWTRPCKPCNNPKLCLISSGRRSSGAPLPHRLAFLMCQVRRGTCHMTPAGRSGGATWTPCSPGAHFQGGSVGGSAQCCPLGCPQGHGLVCPHWALTLSGASGRVGTCRAGQPTTAFLPQFPHLRKGNDVLRDVPCILRANDLSEFVDDLHSKENNEKNSQLEPFVSVEFCTHANHLFFKERLSLECFL